MMLKLRPVKQIDRNGKVLNRFPSAKEAASKIGISLSLCRNMLAGLRGKKKPYRFEYDDGGRVNKYTGNRSVSAKEYKEIREFHQQINGMPKERECMICKRKFTSTWKGNRRCNTCDCNINNNYHVIEYKH